MRQPNAYGESNSHIHANGDSDGNGAVANSDTYSNGDHIAAAFTDATASSDAAAPTVRPAGCFISLGTRERTSRVPAMAAEHLFHARHGSQKSPAIPS
jgi:hypothetical protein